MPKYVEKHFKTILNKKRFIDSWFWDRYSINPYSGCAFGCVYCDARSAKYHMPTDFENEIVVKLNVGEMLDQRISRARMLPVDVVGLGGVTDCYQGIEKSRKNTQDLLQVLLKHGFPVHLSTKSNLITRDSTLLNEIGRKSWCTVSVTITTLDEGMSRFLDRRSPLPSQRLKVVRDLKRNCPNLQVGVNLIPIVPFLNDDEKDLEKMVDAVAASQADFLLFGGGLSLRDTSATWFLKHLKDEHPELFERYRTLYEFSSVSPYDGKNSVPNEYLIPIHTYLMQQCAKRGIAIRIKRFVPDDFRKTNYQCAERLLNSSFRRQLLGRQYSDLFWAGQNIQNLDVSIVDIAAEGKLDSIKNVGGRVLGRVNRLIRRI